jgi:hypothetical protein
LRRIPSLLLCSAALLLINFTVRAQMGMNVFHKPSIANIFHPVVGSGGLYQVTSTDSPHDPPKQQQFSIVGKEAVDGSDAYWMEFADQAKGGGKGTVGKVLISKSDFKTHRMIFQRVGQPAMEMKFDLDAADSKAVPEDLRKWAQAGDETITVPAGTFACQFWKNDAGDKIWVSDKVTPFGIVKQVTKNETRVLLKLVTDAQDQITGPVKVFDPQEMMRQRKQQQSN